MTGWRWAAVLLVAAALRLPQLAIRPMHGDEAVMAAKAGALAWGGEGSAYDPTGYHGTLLGWLARPVLIISGARSLADTDERHFRLVTALCGILLCLTPMLLADGLGANGALIAGLLLAVSPAFVYWSRFYIQEVPLVLATGWLIGCGWRFARTHRRGWLWGTAASAGLMVSLKETAWLSLIAGAAGLASVAPARKWIMRNPSKLWMPVALALAIPALLLGPSALLAPLHYWKLGLSGGDHAHPWHWYFTAMLNPWRESIEWLALLFALVVPIHLFRKGWGLSIRRDLGCFLTVWTGFLTVGYTLLPYKTPWCVLHIVFGGLLLAGVGFEEIRMDRFRWMRARGGPLVPGPQSAVIVAVMLLFIACSAWIWSFRSPADRRNPYVYAQPVEDVRRLGRLVGRIAAVHPRGREMVIAVQVGNPWPLPWELRSFQHTGYWSPGDPEAGAAMWAATVRIRSAVPGVDGLMFGIRPGEVVAVQADAALLRRALARD